MTHCQPLPLADRRNLAAIEREAKELLKQVDFLRRNGDGDQVRFLILRLHAGKALEAVMQGVKRYERKQG